MTDHFKMLRAQDATLEKLSHEPGEVGFFAQEALRFLTIAGTLVQTFPLDNSSIGERQITHILARSLLENYFWLLYIFDDPTKGSERYESKVNVFKREYLKLTNDPLIPKKDQMEPADPTWNALPAALDLRSMLDRLQNDYGDKLSYIYFVYRVASFDTHGNSMAALFQQTFGKECQFSALNLQYGFDLIANQYLVILQELPAKTEA